MNKINKVAVVAKKPTALQIVKKTFNIGEDYADLPGNCLNFSINKDRVQFKYSIEVEQDAFCCGIYSLGGFSIIQDTISFSEKEKVNLIKEGLQKVINIVKECNEEITLMFTTISTKACDLIDKAVKDGELFTFVKSFKNLNSSKVNKLYISN